MLVLKLLEDCLLNVVLGITSLVSFCVEANARIGRQLVNGDSDFKSTQKSTTCT